MSLLLLFHGNAMALPVNADLDVTEGNDTPASTATLDLQASLSVTATNDLASSAGFLIITASASATEADDVGAADATLAVAATLAAPEVDDVPSAAGTVAITTSLAQTEDDEAMAAHAALGVVAVAIIPEEDDTFSATALMPVFHYPRGSVGESEEYESWQREWRENLRRVIERSFLIADGIIHPVTFETIPAPDHSPVIDTLLSRALALDRRRAEGFIAKKKRLQEDEAMAILLLAA